jgi:hypothetical protein
VLLLLCAAEASAGSRISLLPFEGDRPRPLRWRVAYVLKRAGHVVLGYAPPADRSSAAALRNYAEQRNVDLYISGSSVETAQGWDLSLRVRGPDGKALGKPLQFHADNLRGLLIDLKSEGPTKLDRAVRGGAPSGVAELPPGRALPLPTRRTAARKPKAERPVLPGATPESEPAAEAPARTAPAEVDLDAAVAAAARPDTWDADGNEPPAKSRAARSEGRQRRAEPAPARATTKGAARERLATGGMFSSGASTRKRGGDIDLDAATRSALEEGPKSKARPVLDEPAREAASDPLADRAAPAQTSATAESQGETLDADAPEFGADPANESEASEPEAKPKKKGGLFAGRLRRRSPSTEQDSADATPEDRGASDGERSGRPAPPRAVLGARAGFLHRSLAYSEDLYNRLREPTTNGWVYRIDAALYPFVQPLKERISLIGSYEGALAGTVRDGLNKRNFAVKYSDIKAGVRLRQPIGEHELGFQATVGQLTAGLDADSGVTGIPDISYTLLSPSVDLALNLGAVTLRSALGYQRSVGGFGEVANAQWFPHMQGYGFDGQLGLDYRFSASVSFQAAGVVRRFVLDMNSRPEDAIGGKAEVAGGAVDQYLSGYFGVSFAL